MSLSAGSISQDFMWLMKSQTSDDIYPAKCWWLRRKRLYFAFFPSGASVWGGQHECRTKGIACLWTTRSPTPVLLQLLLMMVITLCPPLGIPFSESGWLKALLPLPSLRQIASSLLDTCQQPIIKVFSGGSFSMYYPLWMMSLESGYSNWKEMRPFQFVPLSAAPAPPLSQDKNIVKCHTRMKEAFLWIWKLKHNTSPSPTPRSGCFKSNLPITIILAWLNRSCPPIMLFVDRLNLPMRH